MALNDLATGHGATLTFSSSTYNWAVTSITPPAWETEVLDKTQLSTSDFMQKHPGDLAEPGQITAEILFKRNNYPSPGATTETFTVTWPNEATTAANMAGTGFIVSFAPGALVTNELQTATVVIQYDGATGPTFSAEAAA